MSESSNDIRDDVIMTRGHDRSDEYRLRDQLTAERSRADTAESRVATLEAENKRLRAERDAETVRVDTFVSRLTILEAENGRLRTEQAVTLHAIKPFARVAKGIPCNWRPNCILTFEEMPGGSVRINTLREDRKGGPSISDWRSLEVICRRSGLSPESEGQR